MFEKIRAKRAMRDFESDDPHERMACAARLGELGMILGRRGSPFAREIADALAMALMDHDQAVVREAVSALHCMGRAAESATLALLSLSVSTNDPGLADHAFKALLGTEPRLEMFLGHYLQVCRDLGPLNSISRRRLAPYVAEAVTYVIGHFGAGLAGFSYTVDELLDEMFRLGMETRSKLLEICAQSRMERQVLWARACLVCIGVDARGNRNELVRIANEPTDMGDDVRRAVLTQVADTMAASGHDVLPGRLVGMAKGLSSHASDALREIEALGRRRRQGWRWADRV